MASAVAANPSSPSLFRPSEAAAADIFSAIATGRVSLADLASAHNTTLAALALWLESPEGHERAASISAGLAAAVRIGALARLPAATAALAHIVETFNARSGRTAEPAPSPGPAAVTSAMHDLRERRLAYSAACLIFRITRTPDRPRVQSAPRRDHDTHASTSSRGHSSLLAPDGLLSDPFTGPDPFSPWRTDAATSAQAPLAAQAPAAPASQTAPSPAAARSDVPAPSVRPLAPRGHPPEPAARINVREAVDFHIRQLLEPHEVPAVLASMEGMDDDQLCELLDRTIAIVNRRPIFTAASPSGYLLRDARSNSPPAPVPAPEPALAAGTAGL